MVKYVITEDANAICYDAQQVHGGMGYMKEMNVERLVRDARITTIYEGTSQVQILASSKGVFSDILKDFVEEHQQKSYRPELHKVAQQLNELREIFLECSQYISSHADPAFKAAATKEVVDMYVALYTGYLVMDEAETQDRKVTVVERYVTRALARAHQGKVAVLNEQFKDIGASDEILN
jgi:hypothetical protein